jgi:hypothetical protein
MKRLILCNDGTWNTPDQEENGIPAPTNVFKLSNSIAPEDSGGIAQLVYYHPGVGTGGKVDSLLGGIFGTGTDKQIQSAYHWLGRQYAPGDEIHIFGFSRGAFIARSLAGFLGRGLLKLTDLSSDEAWKRVKTAFEAGYRKHEKREDDTRTWVGKGWKFFHKSEPTPVRLVGVWDTVGALGVPDDLELLNLLDNADKWHFHDTNLGDHIRTARHAMAMDEIRASFTVTRWTDCDAHPDAREIWFPGVHSDVGGGYCHTDLSDGALLWMMEEAEAAGLGLRRGVKESLSPDPLGCLHNSYKGHFAKLRSRPRAMAAMTANNNKLFHGSALDRQRLSPISYPPYHPTRVLQVGESATFEIFADKQWNATGLYLEAGSRFIFSAKGDWQDSRDSCEWSGTQDGKFTAGDIARVAGSFIGVAEMGWKKLTKNASTDFLGSKRVEEFKWFSMVGAVANDAGKGAVIPNDGSPSPHQYVELPEHAGKPLKIDEPGYLYCFANDAWILNGNNHGSIHLTVERVSNTA